MNITTHRAERGTSLDVTHIRPEHDHPVERDAECVPPAPSRGADRRIDTLVADLDDTIFDWTRAWTAGVRAVLSVFTRAGIDAAPLLRDVHCRHRTMEPADALDEIAAAVRGCSIATLRRAARAYASAWQRAPLLQSGVVSTLRELKRRGCRVLAYSESPAAAAAARIQIAGLAGAFDAVICTPERPRSRSPRWPLLPALTGRDHVDCAPWWPKGEAASLSAVLRTYAAVPERTLVVGDHLDKDIGPARTLHLRACWARYGTRRAASDIRLVHALCHWDPKPTLAPIPMRPDDDVPALAGFYDLLRLPALVAKG